MNRDDMNQDKEWEDIVRRLGGTAHQAKSEPASEEAPAFERNDAPLPFPGPRDFTLAEEETEDFRPPAPKPVTTSNPRTLLSWVGVIGSAMIWILAALAGWQLPWWLATVTILGFFGGAVSLFFLRPKTWAHRNRFDGDDYGDGAKI